LRVCPDFGSGIVKQAPAPPSKNGEQRLCGKRNTLAKTALRDREVGSQFLSPSLSIYRGLRSALLLTTELRLNRQG
jgi:hypothetical protein